MTGKLLIDFDSKIPNLALMKTSGYFKEKGFDVYKNIPLGDYDEVWLSCIFTWNRPKARSAIAFQEALGKKVLFGGTGFDWGILDADKRIQLPEYIENRMPDYSFYPEDDRAIGFSQRGCDRKCEFCDVWKKEGKIQRGYIPINLIVPEDRNKLLLLDNDIALSPDHDNIINECRDLGIKLSITQGYDIRCITKQKAEFLAEDKPWDLDFKSRRIYIAWDYLGIENFVKKGIEILLDAGFRASEIFCYMICGFNTTHNEDLYRFYKLYEFGAQPYIMPFNNRTDDKWLNNFKRYVNRGYCRFMDVLDYKDGILAQ
jgi:hypothetical protein